MGCGKHDNRDGQPITFTRLNVVYYSNMRHSFRVAFFLVLFLLIDRKNTERLENESPKLTLILALFMVLVCCLGAVSAARRCWQ